MPRPLVFISHMHQDAAFAEILEGELDSGLLGSVRFFSSSDRDSLRPGDTWREKILAALKEAAVVLVVATPRSVGSPWVNFESGGGWLNGARVIPCCVGNMTPAELPEPLGQRQAIDCTSERGIVQLFESIAEAAEIGSPSDVKGGEIAERIGRIAAVSVGEDDAFARWIRKTTLLPDKSAGETTEGTALVGGHISPSDYVATETFRLDVPVGRSVQCWVEVPGYGTIYHCHATGKVADTLIDMAVDRYTAKKVSARISLKCLGVVKSFSTDIELADEQRGISYEACYLITNLTLLS